MQNENSGEKKTQSLPVSAIGSAVKVVSEPRLRNFAEAVSDSMNLLDDSAKHLFGQMTKLDESDESTPMTAAELAKQIANLARVKLDFVKTMK